MKGLLVLMLLATDGGIPWISMHDRSLVDWHTNWNAEPENGWRVSCSNGNRPRLLSTDGGIFVTCKSSGKR